MIRRGKRRSSPETYTDEELVKMHADGMAFVEIERATGMSKGTVGGRIRRANQTIASREGHPTRAEPPLAQVQLPGGRGMKPAEYHAIAAPAKKSKFRNVPIVIDGERFDSKAELRRWGELQLLQRTGEITLLTRQPTFPLRVNGVLIGRYVGDFSYRKKDGELVVEDVKQPATITAIFKWKARHLAAEHGIEVQVVK